MDNEDNPSDLSPDRPNNRVLKQGENFGDFRVVRSLSSSLLANYYHMQHVRDFHDVTVCIFHERTMQESKCLKRLEGLKASIAKVDHVGIPKITACVEICERHCLVMDPIDGESLSHHFSEVAQPGVGGIGVPDTTGMMALLLGLLGYAHARGLDHRDLDTDLIFVQPDGTLKILGLGVKAALGVDCFESIVSASVSPLERSEDPARLNSFDVMSPEYRSGVPEDSRVDVYAAGCIAYWLLTGVKVNTSAFKRPSSLVGDLVKSWNELIEVAIKRDRDERYQSCKMILIALKGTEQASGVEEVGLIQRQIDCMPVPAGVLERGALVTRIYRLSIIGLVGLVLTAFAASFLKKAYIQDDPPEPAAVVLAVDGATPNFHLKLNPLSAKVRFIGVPEEFSDASGELDFVARPGKYSLLIRAPHYEMETLDIAVGRGEFTERAIELQPEIVDIEIKTLPGSSMILLNDSGLEVELGEVDATGIFSLNQVTLADDSRLLIQQEGYLPKTLEDFPSGVIEVLLDELPSSVSIRTQPVGARVLVNNVDVGESPVTIDASEGNGDYIISVHHAGYRPVVRRIHVELGGSEVVDFGQLTPNFGSLRIQVSFIDVVGSDTASLMDEVEVEIDGRRVLLDSAELGQLPAGDHSVRIVHPNYSSELQAVSIVDDAEEALTFSLAPLPGRVHLKLPGGLSANVSLNGKGVDVKDGVVFVPANQSVEFELRIKDHLSMVRHLEVKPNEGVVWGVNPVRIPAPEMGVDWTVPYIGLEFGWVPAGSFTMGSSLQEAGRLPNEGPQTQVSFSQGFWGSVYEITQAQYVQVMDQNLSEVVGADVPVSSVSWEDAILYCVMLTNLEKAAGRLPEGYVYRLPTEAEWEYLARSGATLPFNFGERADLNNGNFRGVYPIDMRRGQRDGGDHYGARSVGSYEPNSGGFYDIHGNVAEWTLDHYNARLPGGMLSDPGPRADGRLVVVRGGSWEDFAVRVRSAVRAGIRPDIKSNAIGFRVVLAPRF